MSWLKKNVVVVPIDFSQDSKAAVEVAREFVESAKDVHVLHVMPTLEYVAPEEAWITPDDTTRLAKIEHYMNEFAEKNNFADATLVALKGDPGLGIIDYAKEQNADLIVIPSHGYHGFKRWILGSVAERVLRHGHCPTLVLRRSDAQ